MALVRIWLSAAAGVAGLLLLARLVRRRGLPDMPLRLPVLAVLVWAALHLLPQGAVPRGYRPWLYSTDDLLLAFAAIRLALWAGLEVPAGLRWWRPPPQLLLQLLMLGGGVLATIVVVREAARFDLVGLLTTSAVLTAVIGLAAQEPLKDLFAGLELQLSDDFEPGDWLELDDNVRGVVISVSWRDTSLRNLDGALVVVPNSRITQGVVRNLSVSGAITNRFVVGLDYDFPPGQARRLLEQVVRQNPLVLDEPAPSIRVRSFDESAIAYEVHVWQREGNELAMVELRSALLEQIWYALRREGQTVPYPVRQLQPHRSMPPEKALDLPTPETLRQGLAADGLFAALTAEQLAQLVDDSRVVRYGAGEAIVEEDAEGTSLFHLLRGRVEVLKRMAPERIVAVRQLGPGDVFGEMTLFLDAPRSATVRALEECLLLKVGRPAVRSLLEENPDLLERFAALVSARQAELASLGRDQQQAQTNALVETMKRLFFAFTGV